jgi:uncharacterized protein (TIGR01777 family)
VRILVTGGTGFIGKKLTEFLSKDGHEIIILSRSKHTDKKQYKYITGLNEIKKDEIIDLIINLAGAPIDKIWTDNYKKLLIESRVNTSKSIIQLINFLDQKPGLLISASAIGYYGNQGSAIIDESSEPVAGFTNSLCAAWEKEAQKAKDYGVRVCITRLGVVLGKSGGALKKMLPPFKLYLGGKIGTGNQYFSWIHLDDVISAFDFLIQNQNQQGVYNLTAPIPVTNSVFTKVLGKLLGKPIIFSVPEIVIKLLFQEMGDSLLLNGSRVVPKKIMESGYNFHFRDIESALYNILKE